MPQWANEMLRHPNCTTTMLTKARRSAVYRKEVLMEARLRRHDPKLRLISNA